MDELDLSRQRLRCWQEIIGFADFSGFDYNLLSKDLISISIDDPDLKGYFLKAKVWIEMKDWNSVMLTYCTYEPVGVNGTSNINLKLDAGASGTVGEGARGEFAGTQFTCFTSAQKVQILTQKLDTAPAQIRSDTGASGHECENGSRRSRFINSFLFVESCCPVFSSWLTTDPPVSGCTAIFTAAVSGTT